MTNLFMRLWCYCFGHGRTKYVVSSNNKPAYYCTRCKCDFPLDTKGRLW